MVGCLLLFSSPTEPGPQNRWIKIKIFEVHSSVAEDAAASEVHFHAVKAGENAFLCNVMMPLIFLSFFLFVPAYTPTNAIKSRERTQLKIQITFPLHKICSFTWSRNRQRYHLELPDLTCHSNMKHFACGTVICRKANTCIPQYLVPTGSFHSNKFHHP